MGITNLGAVGISAGGVYNSETVYKKYKVVSANGGSYMYINPTPAAGVPVTETSHWQQIAEKGDQGIQGIQGEKGDPGEVTAAELAAVTSQLDEIADIPGTVQTPTFNSNGTVAAIVHTSVESGVVRTDTFVYTPNTITEQRTLASGHVLTLIHHLDTLVTEVM